MSDAVLIGALALEAVAFAAGWAIAGAINKRRKWCPWCGERHLRQCEAQRRRQQAQESITPRGPVFRPEDWT